VVGEVVEEAEGSPSVGNVIRIALSVPETAIVVFLVGT